MDTRRPTFRPSARRGLKAPSQGVGGKGPLWGRGRKQTISGAHGAASHQDRDVRCALQAPTPRRSLGTPRLGGLHAPPLRGMGPCLEGTKIPQGTRRGPKRRVSQVLSHACRTMINAAQSCSTGQAARPLSAWK